MKLGRLSTSKTVHIINKHDLSICLGHKADVIYERNPKRRKCRLCFGQKTNLGAPSARLLDLIGVT